MVGSQLEGRREGFASSLTRLVLPSQPSLSLVLTHLPCRLLRKMSGPPPPPTSMAGPSSNPTAAASPLFQAFPQTQALSCVRCPSLEAGRRHQT